MIKYRDYLSEEAIVLFENIETGRVLGASNHILMIADMLIDISKNQSVSEASRLARIKELVAYYKQTRGESSYAIIHALDSIMTLIEPINITQLEDSVEKIIHDYYIRMQDESNRILKYTKRLLNHKHKIMIFDYSSTVEKAICELSEKEIIILESRAINGGLPFVEKIRAAGHKIIFLPDVAMLQALSSVDAVLIGAETYYPDGTAFNTIGSDILAELCFHHKIPYYVLTPTSKRDPRAQYAIYKKEIGADLVTTMSKDWLISKEGIDFYCIELVAISPQFITSYITEKGIIPAYSIFNMKGEMHDE